MLGKAAIGAAAAAVLGKSVASETTAAPVEAITSSVLESNGFGYSRIAADSPSLEWAQMGHVHAEGFTQGMSSGEAFMLAEQPKIEFIRGKLEVYEPAVQNVLMQAQEIVSVKGLPEGDSVLFERPGLATTSDWADPEIGAWWLTDMSDPEPLSAEDQDGVLQSLIGEVVTWEDRDIIDIAFEAADATLETNSGMITFTIDENGVVEKITVHDEDNAVVATYE